jgi:SOS-response transcriptional repressor LexA
VRELEAYLQAAGFSDCSLSLAEKNAILNPIHSTIPIKIGDFFVQQRGKEKAPNQVKSGNVPMINETSSNNGFTKLATPSKVFAGNAISISINYATTVFYQPKDFCASVNISILKNDEILTENTALYFATLLQKNNRQYDYNHKISKDKINETILLLPAASDGSIDFEFMENYINAVKKQTIVRLKEFIEREHKAYLKVTQQISENQEEQKELKITLIHPDYQPGRIPLYTLRAACGYFEDGQEPEEEGWIDASGLGFTPDPKRHFAVHAKGDSMLPKIYDGDICIFEWYNAGSRNSEIVLSQSREYDSEYGGKYTIKRYHSEKTVTEEGWQHSKVELQPLNPDFDTIELDEFGEYKTIGIFKCVL